MNSSIPRPVAPKPKFDGYAADYRELLDRSVAMSGESGEYFLAVKACYAAAKVGAGFSGRVLDFGCGVGLQSSQLKKALPAARMDGYDPSSASLDRVDAALRAQGQFVSDLTALPGEYDLVVVSNVMHHVPKDQRQSAISDVARLMAPGGRLMIFEHNPANPLTRYVVHHCPFDDDAVLLWPRETQDHLHEAGLEVRSRDYIVFFPRWLAALRAAEPALNWCPLGAQYVVTGVKR